MCRENINICVFPFFVIGVWGETHSRWINQVDPKIPAQPHHLVKAAILDNHDVLPRLESHWRGKGGHCRDLGDEKEELGKVHASDPSGVWLMWQETGARGIILNVSSSGRGEETERF